MSPSHRTFTHVLSSQSLTVSVHSLETLPDIRHVLYSPPSHLLSPCISLETLPHDIRHAFAYATTVTYGGVTQAFCWAILMDNTIPSCCHALPVQRAGDWIEKERREFLPVMVFDLTEATIPTPDTLRRGLTHY
ncbi:hypothetical protein J6590_013659 [Homalodisca vitripennis]|nr:hypothetical protein J6590_013659 [Homalodisca vitripennis]